jgi:GTP-binding protein|eukprot:COSAG01_NODE_1813_length_9172_cov_347.085528_2_plen_480_part_00
MLCPSAISVRCTAAAAQAAAARVTRPQPRLYSNAAAQDIRNLAIIAHVDHGKTTLMDKILLNCEENGAAHAAALAAAEGDRMVDSMDQERERGITIVSKVTGVVWKGTRLNVVDTPGHADFGGEVERVLRMVDGVVLVVDATDGPNTQTTFVTEKALQHGLRPLVVLNKIDRETARVTEVENEIFDLLVGLGATDEQLDFQFIYASARDGWAVDDLGDRTHAEICALAEDGSMAPLMDAILDAVPAPAPLSAEEAARPFAMSVSMTTADAFLGKMCTGRVASGSISAGDPIFRLPLGSTDGPVGGAHKVKELRGARGMGWTAVNAATRGEIIQVAGVAAATVGDTLAGAGLGEALAAPAVDPPTLTMTFSPNTSPVLGQEGSKLTSELIRARLKLEAENNISIEIKPGEQSESFEVCARGEMQLGVLIGRKLKRHVRARDWVSNCTVSLCRQNHCAAMDLSFRYLLHGCLSSTTRVATS